jgi:hypothetical protein
MAVTRRAILAAARSLEARDGSLKFAVTMSPFGMDAPIACESTAAMLRLALAWLRWKSGTAIIMYLDLAALARQEIIKYDPRKTEYLNELQAMVQRRHRDNRWILHQTLLEGNHKAESYLKFYRALERVRYIDRGLAYVPMASAKQRAIALMASNIEEIIGRDQTRETIMVRLPDPVTPRSFMVEMKERER